MHKATKQEVPYDLVCYAIIVSIILFWIIYLIIGSYTPPPQPAQTVEEQNKIRLHDFDATAKFTK